MPLDQFEESHDVEMSFLDHIEALRWHLLRSAVAIVVLSVLAFIAKDFVFHDVFLGPSRLDFWTYKYMCVLSHAAGLGESLCVTDLGFSLINTAMAGQFTQHITISISVGLALAFPYLAWEIWRFFRPALSKKERRYTKSVVFISSILFFAGLLFGYYVITPITVQFLGGYRLSEEIANTITIEDYISMVTMTTLSIALVFELPMVVFFLSLGGIITPKVMRTYRRYAVVIILVLAAMLTPSSDILSMMLVAVPFFLLYEMSILVSYFVEKRRIKKHINENSAGG